MLKIKKNHMQKESKVMFSEIGEDEIVKVWYSSKSKAEVLRGFKGIKFWKQRKTFEKANLPPFHLKKVNDLNSSEIIEALNDVSIKTLKNLCIKLNLAKKIQNAALKKRIKSEQIDVSEHIYKSIYETKRTPWEYPRSYFIKRNKKIPTTCPPRPLPEIKGQCVFIARVPKQIQLHHVKLKAESRLCLEEEKFRGSSLKRQQNYQVSPNLKTICANCHSLEHHPRGQIEKESCGLWLRKKTTNPLYKNPMKMFQLGCLHTHTLQKKDFIRTLLKQITLS